MGQPLRDMDKAQLLLEQIARVNALAEANGIAPLNLGPLARMALSAAMHQVHDKNNEVIVALGGTAIPWGGPLKDPAAAAIVLDQSMDYTDILESEEEEEGSVPEWVSNLSILGGTLPSHAIDCIGVQAWDGSEVALSTLIGADATGGLEAAWGTAAYPAVEDFTANGLADADSGGEIVAFIGPALTKILSGATIVYKVLLVTGVSGFSLFMIGDSGGNKFIVAGDPGAEASCRAYSYNSLNDLIPNCLTFAALPGSSNTIAITITPTRLEMSVNGSAALAFVLDTSEYQDMVCAGMDPMTGLEGVIEEGYIQSVAIFDPVAIGDLPTVST